MLLAYTLIGYMPILSFISIKQNVHSKYKQIYLYICLLGVEIHSGNFIFSIY